MSNVKKMVIMDCKIILQKLGDTPGDIGFEILNNDLQNIGFKYGLSSKEVFKILMDNFKEIGESYGK